MLGAMRKHKVKNKFYSDYHWMICF